MKRMALNFGVMKKARLFGLAVLAVLLGANNDVWGQDITLKYNYKSVADGDWETLTTWADEWNNNFTPTVVPGNSNSVGLCGGFTVTLTSPSSVKRMDIMDGSTLNVNANLTINSNDGRFVIKDGTVNVAAGCTLRLDNNDKCRLSLKYNPTISGEGLLDIAGNLGENDGTLTTNINTILSGDSKGRSIIVDGKEFKTTRNGNIFNNVTINENGSFNVDNGTTIAGALSLYGGTLQVASGKTLTATTNPVNVSGDATISGSASGTAATLAANVINLATDKTLTIDGIVNLSSSVTFTGSGKLKIANGGTLTIGGTPTLPENITIENGGTLNLTGDVTLSNNITIEDGGVLSLGGANVYFANEDLSKTANITGAGTIKFSKNGDAIVHRFTNCTDGVTATYQYNKWVTYNNTCTHIIPGSYYSLTVDNSSISLCGNVTVNNEFKPAQNMAFDCEGGAKTFVVKNAITNGKSLTFNNVNVTLGNSERASTMGVTVSQLNTTNGGTITLVEDVLVNQDVTLNAAIELENSDLHIGDGKKLYFGENANITSEGTGKLFFNGTSTIYGLTDCLGVDATFGGTGKTITYDNTCSRILAGTYTNLTTNNSGTLTLCGNVVVNGTYRLNSDIIIKGKTGNETITHNGPITNNRSLTLLVNAFANGTNSFSVSRFNIGKNNTFTINGATTISSNVNIDSTGIINVADGATLTFSNSATFNASTTISGNGNVYFNAYVKASGTKLTTYPTVTLADVGSNMLIDTIEVKGETFNYNRSNNVNNQRPIRSLIVDGGTFALNIPNWASMNLTGAAILKSGTLQMAAGKTLKLTNTDCDTLKVTGTATIDGNGVIDAVVAVYANGNLTIAENMTIRQLVVAEDNATVNVAKDKTLTLNSPMQVNGNATLNTEADSETNIIFADGQERISVLSGRTLTIGSGNINISNAVITLDGALNIESAGSLTVEATNVNFTRLSSLDGAGAMNFTNSSPIIGSLTTCLGGNVVFEENSTVTYDEMCTRIIPSTYYNLVLNTSVGKNITLCDLVEVSNDLTWNNGRIVLNGNELKLHGAYSVGGTPGLDHMVVADENGKLTYTGLTGDNNLSFPVGSYNSISKTYMYAPVDISGITAAAEYSVSVATVGSAVSGLSTDLKRYWNIETTGALGDGGTLTLHYDSADDGFSYGSTLNDEGVGYWKAYNGSYALDVVSPFGGRIITITAAKINEIDGCSISGTWTAAESTKVATLYAHYTGSWDNPDIWTTDPTGKTHVNPNNKYPNKSFDAVILSPYTVRKPDSESKPFSARTVQIALGATIDAGTRSPDFTNVYGQGTLRIDGDFPTEGNYKEFMSKNGGTTEFYGPHPTNTITQYEYNNLVLNYTGSSESTLPADKQLLNINGNLTLTHGSLHFSANGQAIHVGGNINIAEGCGIYIYEGGGHHTDTLQVGGSLINHGTIRMTHRVAANYNNAMAKSDEGDAGRGIIRFTGEEDARFECYGETRLAQLFLTKGTDHTSRLTVYSDSYDHFSLLGKAKDSYLNKDFSTNMYDITKYTKPIGLWCGTLELTGKIRILSLSEGDNKEEDGMMFFIPSTAGMHINGHDVEVYVRTDDGKAKESWANFISSGHFRIDDGKFDTRAGSGMSFRGTAFMEIKGGTVRCAQFRPEKSVSNGIVTYIQSGGKVIVDGQGGFDAPMPAFYMPFSANTFIMTGGTIEVSNSGRSGNSSGSSSKGGAFVVGCNPSTSSITGGEIIVNTGRVSTGNNPCNSDYLISCAIPLWNLTLRNDRLYYNNSNVAYSYTGHKLSDHVGNVQKTDVSFTCATEIKNDLRICENVLFKTDGKSLTIGGNLIIEEGATVETGDNEIIFNGGRLQRLTNNGSVSSTGGAGFYSLTVNSGTQLKPVQNTTLYGTLTLHDGAELVDGVSNIVYTIYGNANISGAHKASAFNGSILFAGNGSQTIAGSGNGLLNNVNVNKSGGTLQLTAPRLTITGDLRLLSNIRFDIGNNNLNLANTANIYTDAYTATAFTADRMIMTSGGASAEGLTRQYSSARKSMLFPIGLNHGGTYYYLPAEISYMEATTFGSVTTRVVDGAHPFSDAGNSLQCYWITDEQGFAGVNNITQNYWYATTGLVMGTLSNYVPARYHAAEWATEGTAGVHKSDDARYFTFGGAESASGHYTCGDKSESAFAEIMHLYSSNLANGTNWDSPLSWTTTKVGDAPTFENASITYKYNSADGVFQAVDANGDFVPDGATMDLAGAANYLVPTATTAVTIGSGEHNHTIVMNADGQGCASLTLADGSTLDMGVTVDHNFPLVDVETYGAGKLVIGSAYFPSGDFVKFLGANGGTVEYQNNSGAAFAMPTISTCRNLVISGADAVELPNADIHIYDSLTVNGQAQILGSTSRNITIDGNLNIISGQMLINCSTSQAMVIGGDVKVAEGAAFATGADGADNLDHNIQIGGSLEANGQFQQYSGNKKNRILLTFVGTNTAYIKGSAKITVCTITCDKGSDMSSYLIIQNKELNSISNKDLLNLKNGTCQIDIGDGNTINLSTQKNVIVESTARLSIKSGTSIIAFHTSTYHLILNGALEVLGGKLYIGKSESDYNRYASIKYSPAGLPSITVSGGQLIVNGAIRRQDKQTLGSLIYNQSGGEVIVKGKNRKGENSTDNDNMNIGLFEVLNTGEFNLSGGTLNVCAVDFVNGASGTASGDIFICPAKSSNSGGQIVVGDGSTVTEQKLITNVSINSLKIMPHATLGVYTYPIEAKDITIEDFGDLQLRGHALTIRHGLYNNNVGEVGDENKGFEVGDANHTTYFVGSNMEYKGASGNRTCFANLQITGSMQLVGSNSDIQVNKKLTLTSNTVTDNGNTITLIGDIENNGKFVSNAETGGIKFLGEGASQYIRGRGFGEFGSVTVANPMRVILNTNVTINKKLTLDGLLYINNSLLTLGKNATVEAAGSSRLDENRMILLNGAQDDYGVRKILPAISSGSSTEILIPIGIDGNYTPAKYIFEENKVAGASITVKTINYLNRNLAQTPPSFYLDYYWCVSTAGFNEENDENGDTNGNFKVTQEYLYTEALMVDKHTHETSEADMLPEYQRTLKKNSWISLSSDSYVDAGTHTITFGQMGHLDGEYTAGVVETGKRYTELPYLYSLKSSTWDDLTMWGITEDGCPNDSPFCVDGHYAFVPDGNPIIIQNGHTVEVVADGTHAYSLEFAGLESTLNVAETFGNDFGRIHGVGRIQMEATLERPFMFPAGDFANFMADPRSVVIFDSKNRDGIMAKTPGTSSQPLQNVIIKGSYKTKIMASDAWVINGNLTLEDGATLDNTGYNTPIRIGGNWVDTTGSAGFLPGTSTVEFNGDSTQRILIKRADNAVFYGLAINNSGAAGSDSVIVGLNTKDGYKSFRITKNLNLVDGYLIVDTTLHAPVLASSASVSGASAASFVSGPIGREMTAGGSFKFPVGRNGRYAETPLSGVSETGIWMVDYVDSLYSEYNDDDMPVQQVSNEYWRMYAPSASATAKIGLRYDSQTLPSVNKNNVKQLAKLTVVDHPDDIWNQLESTRSNSTLTTVTAQVAQGYENVYSIGYIGTTARFDESAEISYQICDNGGKARIPILFTGTPDYNLTYKVSYDGSEVSRKSVTFSGDGNLTIAAADLGFRSTTTPYIVELVSLTDASGEGSITYRKNGAGVDVDRIEVYIYYNALPEISGDDEVGRGDMREYAVVPYAGAVAPYADSAYLWTGSGVSAVISPNNERETNVTFNENGSYTLNAQVTYKYSNGLSCTNKRDFDISVLPEPTPHIVTAYGLNACTGAETGRTYTYSTTAVPNHSYEWTATNGEIKSGINSNVCVVEWFVGETEGTLEVKEWITTNSEISGTDTKNVTLYPVPSLSDVTIEMPVEVCYGTGADIKISAKDGYSFKVYDNSNNAALSGDISSGDEPFLLSTTSFTKEQSIYLVVKNDGCSKQTLPQTVGVELAPDLKLEEIPALYIGKSAVFGYTNQNTLTSMSYSFNYDDGTVIGTTTLSSPIEINVPVTLENLKGVLHVTSNEGDLSCSADYVINKPVSQEYLWKGLDSNWDVATNWWPDAVPTEAKSAHISVDGKRNAWPTISASASVNTLTIESGAMVNVAKNETLTIYGDVDCAGVFDGEGIVAFTDAEHNISGSSVSFANLTNNGTVTAANGISVNGTLNNLGHFVGDGIVSMSSGATLEGNGSFRNITFNNAVVVKGKPTINKEMTMNGVVTAEDQINIGPEGSMKGSGWVDGAVHKRWGDSDKLLFKFVVGSSDHAAPVGVTPTANGAEFTANYTFTGGADPITEGEIDGMTRVSAMESWDIKGSTSSRITLYISEFSGVTEKNGSVSPGLVIAHEKSTGVWEKLDASVSGKSITTSDPVSSYSAFTFGTTNADEAIHPLPVTFAAFTGRQDGNSIVLEWTTLSEKDNDYFEIERSTDGVNYVAIGFVDGAGNSAGRIDYNFADNSPESGYAYYRLSQVDFDGTREYADRIVTVYYTSGKLRKLVVVPNPTNGLFRVSASGSMAGGRIELLSQSGTVIRIINISSFDATVDICDLPNGIYVLRFVTDTNILQQKVVKY